MASISVDNLGPCQVHVVERRLRTRASIMVGAARMRRGAWRRGRRVGDG